MGKDIMIYNNDIKKKNSKKPERIYLLKSINFFYKRSSIIFFFRNCMIKRYSENKLYMQNLNVENQTKHNL